MTPSGAWRFSQRFSLRASTLLLLYFPLLICLGYASNHMSGQVPIYVALFVGASGQRFAVLMLIAAIFGLAFFVASVVKRNPQFQFLIEALIAARSLSYCPCNDETPNRTIERDARKSGTRPSLWTLAAMTRVTWPITVGAVLYFLYAAAFLAYSLAAYFVGDAKLSAARALVGAFVAFICGILGTALLRAKDGNTGWLLWTGGAAGALAGMSTGWLGTVLFLLPMAFGLWGLLQTQHGS